MIDFTVSDKEIQPGLQKDTSHLWGVEQRTEDEFLNCFSEDQQNSQEANMMQVCFVTACTLPQTANSFRRLM